MTRHKKSPVRWDLIDDWTAIWNFLHGTTNERIAEFFMHLDDPGNGPSKKELAIIWSKRQRLLLEARTEPKDLLFVSEKNRVNGRLNRFKKWAENEGIVVVNATVDTNCVYYNCFNKKVFEEHKRGERQRQEGANTNLERQETIMETPKAERIRKAKELHERIKARNKRKQRDSENDG